MSGIVSFSKVRFLYPKRDTVGCMAMAKVQVTYKWSSVKNESDCKKLHFHKSL